MTVKWFFYTLNEEKYIPDDTQKTPQETWDAMSSEARLTLYTDIILNLPENRFQELKRLYPGGIPWEKLPNDVQEGMASRWQEGKFSIIGLGKERELPGLKNEHFWHRPR